MDITIESAKDEIAKRHDCENYGVWKFKTGLHSFTDELMNEAAELYHLRKCEEAGKELPSQDAINTWMNVSEKYWSFRRQGAEWMKQRASLIISILKSKLETQEKEIERLKVFEPVKTEGVMTIHSESRRNISVQLPKTIPMSLLNEEQAKSNHGQSLERLNERGGLGVGEILDIIHRRKWGTTDDSDVAAEQLLDILKEN